MHYDHRLRPSQPGRPPLDAFALRWAEVAEGLRLAFVREGAGGYPLVLLHGYPETKRIWWRNIGPLAAAGYEVIVPDLRGYGDSDLAPGGDYDLAAYSRDVHTLVQGHLGHERVGLVGGDVGGAVAVDFVHRFPGAVDKVVVFNTVPPMVVDRYAAAGIDVGQIRALGAGPTSDYRVRQGSQPEELAAELDTPERRRRYVAEMYGHRLWASPGTFAPDDVEFMTEPFADPERLQAAWAVYQLAYGRQPSEPPIMDRVVDLPALILYGPDDHVVGPDFVHCCEVAFPNRVGPLVVPGAGHFLQWERADVINPLVASFFGDCRERHRR